jgi:Putative transposase DNA-binding domain
LRYATIAVEDCDWRKLMLLPDVASNEQVNEAARRHQRIAAVGMLRGLLVGAGATPVNAADTTKTCHLCGHINEFVDRLPLVLECGGCGSSWDQDRNAAHVLLARAKAISAAQPGETLEPENQPRGRWGKRKADRSRRLAGTVG